MSVLGAVILLIPFYLIGAFPTGVLVSRLYGIDITASGSGNIGATNVARVVGKRAGLYTLLGDVCKGALAVFLAHACSSNPSFVAAVAAAVVCGHCFSLPPFMKGGKGVATALGAIVAINPSSAAVALVAFAATFTVSHIVSVASLAAALAVPVSAFLMNLSEAKCLCFVVMSSVVVYRHRENIQRLIEGKEPPFQFKKASE